MNETYTLIKDKILSKHTNTVTEGSLITIVGAWVQSEFNKGDDNRIIAARNLGSGWEIWA